MEKLLWTSRRVRYADSDPMQHLYSGNFFRYFLDAREDQVREAYGLDFSVVAQTEMMAWVVAESQIAFLKEAKVNEKIWISTCMTHAFDRFIDIEGIMWAEDKKHIKALQWTRFALLDLKTRKSMVHPEKWQNLFDEVKIKLPTNDFQERFHTMRQFNKGRGPEAIYNC